MMVVMILSKRMRYDGDYCDGDDGDEIEEEESEKWCWKKFGRKFCVRQFRH